jgi:hypothetical protein
VLTWTVDAIHRFDNNCSRDPKALCVIKPAAIGPDQRGDGRATGPSEDE